MRSHRFELGICWRAVFTFASLFDVVGQLPGIVHIRPWVGDPAINAVSPYCAEKLLLTSPHPAISITAIDH